MKPLEFSDLVRLPVIEQYEAAFRQATGVVLKIVPPEPPATRLSCGKGENPVCTLLTSTPAGCQACLDVQKRILRGVGQKAAPCQGNCFAGMTDVAVPVFADGRHVATLWSGELFRREPTERDFLMVVKALGIEQNGALEKQLRKAYFESPTATSERFEAVLQLLKVFAEYIGEHAHKQALAGAAAEPPAVAGAKAFVQSHVEERLTLSDVVRHVNVSRFYFCKLFKKATGMTLTEYISRSRVEKAKKLLSDRSLRITEIVYSAGFGSIPQFNSVFKRVVGMPPTAYRETLPQAGQ